MSPALNALINPIMAGAVEQRVVWPDVQVDTFVAFAQFAYGGTYVIAFDLDDEATATEPRSLTPGSKSETSARNSLRDKTLPASKKRTLSQIVIDDSAPIQAAKPKSSRSYASLFLGHARLYALAEKYGAQGLKALALAKLKDDLALYKRHKEWSIDVVRLIEYVFSDHTPAGGKDQLRQLLLEFVGQEILNLRESKHFVTMLENGGEFVKCFWPLILSWVK
jgi:hypothetical protein